MMGHVKELTLRVRANEKVVASVSLLGVIACTFIGAGYFAPKAEACSPPIDGSDFTCPPHDGVLERPVAVTEAEEDEPRYYNDFNNGKIVFVDTREDKPLVIMETYHHMVDSIRNWKMQKERTPVEDMINNALSDMENDNGSDDPTKQEELLQLSSNGD